MSTVYSNTSAIYTTNLSDGMSSSGQAITVPIGSVPQAVLDDAADAFFTVVNDWMPVVSSDKIIVASGNDDWEWTAP